MTPDEIMESGEEYLILFFAEWAAPSMDLKRRLEGFNRMHVIMIDAEESPKTTLDMGVKALPTLFLMKGRDVLNYKIGYDTEETLNSLLPED